VPTPHRSFEDRFSFGGRVPWGVGLVIVVTLVLSLAVALTDRHAGSIFERTALVPGAVWQGQVWRLATWTFVEQGPLGLIFGCLFLYWFGGELGRLWGSPRFLQVYLGVGLFAALATCLLARIDSALLDEHYLGGWAASAGLTIAWGLSFPDRVIRIYFVLPIRGVILAWGTVGLTVVYAVYSGWQSLLPELAAEAAMVAWMHRRRFLPAAAAAARAPKRRVPVPSKKRPASVSYLRVVKKNDNDE